MNYYKEIKTKILDNEAYERIKDYSKERHRVLTYFEIGRLLYEAGKHYGESIINKYAQSLKKDFGKKYDKRLLFRMRKFYVLFKEYNNDSKIIETQKVVTDNKSPSKNAILKEYINQKVVTDNNLKHNIISFGTKTTATPQFANKLTWSHYECLLSIKNDDERYYFANTATNNNLSVRELRKRIKSNEYNRLDYKTRAKLIAKDNLSIKDYIPNPILIKNTSDKEEISEKLLHNLIMEDITSFMKELGDGFSFIDNEYKIKIDDRYNYIDLLLYNIKYKCYVIIELKVTEFKSEYIGQILKYMNYIDKNLKTINEDKTIGIIICKKNNHFYMEYCSDERVISREYKLIN